MKILIAADKFKGSLSSQLVCECISNGLCNARNDLMIICQPLADGGEGSIDILAKKRGMQRKVLSVKDPLMRPVEVYYYLFKKKAYIELAIASGLELLTSKERSATKTSTFGTGEMIADALSQGAKEINLFVGGSATNDAGIGIAHALGYLFLDETGSELAPVGANLLKIKAIDNTQVKVDFKDIKINLFTDVLNPLYGSDGAAHVYASQKGASQEDIECLDGGLNFFANVLMKRTGRDLSKIAGMGAAGGVGACLVGLMEAKIKSGIDFIIKETKLEQLVQDCDLIISGEGQLDAQSLQGKVVGSIARIAMDLNIPLVLFVGKNQLSLMELKNIGSPKVFTIIDLVKDKKKAMSMASDHLKKLSYDFAKTLEKNNS